VVSNCCRSREQVSASVPQPPPPGCPFGPFVGVTVVGGPVKTTLLDGTEKKPTGLVDNASLDWALAAVVVRRQVHVSIGTLPNVAIRYDSDISIRVLIVPESSLHGLSCVSGQR
jgi:hypothetical protein